MTRPHDSAAPAVVVVAGDAPRKFPRAIGRSPTTTIKEVREEASRVYRAMCAGKLSTKEGTSVMYMLQTISKMIEVEKIEPVLEQIRAWQRQNELPR